MLPIGLGLLGLACSGAAALGVGLALSPIAPGRLAYYALVAGGSLLRLAGLGIIGCLLLVPAASRAGPQRRLAVAALGLGALSATVSASLSAMVFLLARSRGLSLSLRGSMFRPHGAVAALPELVTFASEEGWRLNADLYRPQSPSPRTQRAPAVIVVHGGAWRWGDKGENPTWNRWLAERGYLVLDVQYSLAPRAAWRVAVHDLHRAVAWLRTHADELGADPNRIALLGRSAGGHLALLAAYTSEPVVDHVEPRPLWRVVAFYAPTDLTRLYAEARRFHHDDLRAGMRASFGGGPAENREGYRLASPLERLHSGVPATLLVHGAWDRVVPPDHSRHLACALTRAGVHAQFVSIPFARHAFDLVGYGSSTLLAREAVFAFLSEGPDGSQKH
jgi:acetyl esterase/lipase